MKLAQLLILGFVCSMPVGAVAQWQWVDNQGKKVFSDQAPPIEIPEKNILRRPGVSPSAVSAPATAPAAPAEASAAKPTGVDKELADKTKKAEEVEKAKQAEEAAKIAKARADNCARAKQGKATFDSGIRVARVNAKGEREVMDDKARADEQKRLQTVIASDCK